jgi:hypothetical protein
MKRIIEYIVNEDFKIIKENLKDFVTNDLTETHSIITNFISHDITTFLECYCNLDFKAIYEEADLYHVTTRSNSEDYNDYQPIKKDHSIVIKEKDKNGNIVLRRVSNNDYLAEKSLAHEETPLGWRDEDGWHVRLGIDDGRKDRVKAVIRTELHFKGKEIDKNILSHIDDVISGKPSIDDFFKKNLADELETRYSTDGSINIDKVKEKLKEFQSTLDPNKPVQSPVAQEFEKLMKGERSHVFASRSNPETMPLDSRQHQSYTDFLQSDKLRRLSERGMGTKIKDYLIDKARNAKALFLKKYRNTDNNLLKKSVNYVRTKNSPIFNKNRYWSKLKLR